MRPALVRPTIPRMERAARPSVSAERRLRTLHALSVLPASVTTPDKACALALETLVSDSADVAFALVYLFDKDGANTRLGGAAGFSGVDVPAASVWPLEQAAAGEGPIVLHDLDSRLGPLVDPRWPEPAHSGIALPLRSWHEERPFGVLIAGLSPQRALDAAYRDFFEMAAVHVSAAVASAVTRDYALQRCDPAGMDFTLQDDALQTFFVIGLVARAALMELGPERVSEPVAVALAQVGTLANTGSEHLREALFALTHAEVDRRGVVPALWRLVRRFQQRTGIEADLVVSGAPGRLPIGVAEVLHTVGREALASVERHSKASAVLLGLRVGPRTVTLSIQDDGAGPSGRTAKRVADSATHFGLRGVGERVRRLGGTFVAKPVRDGGFVVRTRLPLGG
jgi:GAF domain